MPAISRLTKPKYTIFSYRQVRLNRIDQSTVQRGTKVAQADVESISAVGSCARSSSCMEFHKDTFSKGSPDVLVTNQHHS
jgi:hypothetical protein